MPEPPRRQKLRLTNWEYHWPAVYIVTICVNGRRKLLGNIDGRTMQPSPAGRMVEEILISTLDRFPCAAMDQHVIMPNHIHVLVEIDDSRKGTTCQEGSNPRGAGLPMIIGTFKSLTTVRYIEGVRNDRWAPFQDGLWQRGYWDHIVRDEQSLARIRRYIDTNPLRWANDRENSSVKEELDFYEWLEGKHRTA